MRCAGFSEQSAVGANLKLPDAAHSLPQALSHQAQALQAWFKALELITKTKLYL
jgi:hypothetical protein